VIIFVFDLESFLTFRFGFFHFFLLGLTFEPENALWSTAIEAVLQSPSTGTCASLDLTADCLLSAKSVHLWNTLRADARGKTDLCG